MTKTPRASTTSSAPPTPSAGLLRPRAAAAGAILALVAAACGGSPDAGAPAKAQPTAPAAGAAPSSGAAPSPGVFSTLAIPGAGSSNHALYASNGLTCQQCHPCGKRDPNGHAVAWMDRTSSAFHAFAANADLAACQGCHGAALDGVGGRTSVSCAQCHGAAWKTTCTTCHGGTDGTTGAPPRTVWGRSSEAVRVGAHTAHLSASHGLAAAVTCATCHTVPADALSTGHVNGATGDVTFSGIAVQGGAASWDRASATCTTYCHGATLGAGGALTAPVWTESAGAARACTACHGAPPPAPHTTSTACGGCHPGYTATSVNASTHVNGIVETSPLACNSCHGSTANAAPPVGTRGETATTTRAVGAHQRHLSGGSIGNAVACNECHAVPTATNHADGTVQLTWGTLSRSGGATPSFDGATLSCASTYCHGATLAAGGTNQRPVWTGGSAEAACGTCHGAPPPAPHTTSTACGSCHAGYTATSVNLATHVDGKVDVTNLTCTSCHGASGRTATAASPLYAAPPLDASGAASGVRVGAHQRHLVAGTYSNPISCQTCHASVASYSVGHANGTREVGFTGAASANLRLGTWTAGSGSAAGSCSASWCHGAVITRAGGAVGGTLTAPTWTGAVTACTACHAVTMTSLSGRHTSVSNHRRYACSTCHGAGYTATVTNNVATGTGVNLATHVDGTRTIVTITSGTGIRSWNATTRSCQPSCHGTKTW